MKRRNEDEPVFAVLDYITITREPRAKLVVAIGGGHRAAGILQTTGGFVSAPGPHGDYQRLPHTMPVEEQRHGATAAAHALLLAGFSVHLDPTLNTLAAPDGDRQAAHRYLEQLAERARSAADDQEVAKVLTEIAAPHDGLLHRLTQTLISVWFPWSERLRNAGHEPEPAHQLMMTTGRLSDHAREIELIRDRAARTPHAPVPATSPPKPFAGAPSRARSSRRTG